MNDYMPACVLVYMLVGMLLLGLIIGFYLGRRRGFE